ncbi:translation initiation factor IF-2-like [Homarus americanus]|uniref:translation initiation factor IF-2-like n=1 Tax=Homarus americanus TaxID=6706 RepID=UPI001C4442FC|nr:translation initiation factor IF-2-like [Homarus americanus]
MAATPGALPVSVDMTGDLPGAAATPGAVPGGAAAPGAIPGSRASPGSHQGRGGNPRGSSWGGGYHKGPPSCDGDPRSGKGPQATHPSKGHGTPGALTVAGPEDIPQRRRCPQGLSQLQRRYQRLSLGQWYP